MDQENASRRGYLEEDFRLFHLKDAVMGPVDWHYHSFHKILVLLAGRASYAIEGQSYALEPGDVVLVPRGSIHRPEIAPGQAKSAISGSFGWLSQSQSTDSRLATLMYSRFSLPR